MDYKSYIKKYPNNKGYFSSFGGRYVDDKDFEKYLEELASVYESFKNNLSFITELNYHRAFFVGRPSPIYYCENLSKKYGNLQIYLKRDDLTYSQSHKINHALAFSLLAKKLGLKKLICETGSGQHGVALSMCARKFNLECEVHMGEADIKKHALSVKKMRLFGAKIVCVDTGDKSVKASYDSALKSFQKSLKTSFYCPGSAIGPHPYPKMVRDFQLVTGVEAKDAFYKLLKVDPDFVVASVSGGSTSLGFFLPFLGASHLFAAQALGVGKNKGDNAATLTFGETGIMQGFKTIFIQNKDGSPAEVYSLASGLSYPAVGPELAYLKEENLISVINITDKEALDAFFSLCKYEGIIPSLEASHALALCIKLSASEKKAGTALVNLSGSGDKDLEYVFSKYESDFLKSIK